MENVLRETGLSLLTGVRCIAIVDLARGCVGYGKNFFEGQQQMH